MNLIASLFVSSLDVDRAILNVLKQRFPFGVKGAAFSVELPLQDPKLRELIEFLDGHKLRKRDYSRAGPNRKGEYCYDVRRTYETEDFDEAQYLRLVHTVKVCEDQNRNAEGRLILERCRLASALHMGCVPFDATVVSDSTRQNMMAEELQGVSFRELVLIPAHESFNITDRTGKVIRRVSPEDQDHIEKRGKYWELTSTVTLPPIEGNWLLDREGKPFTGDYSQGVCLKDEYRPSEIHYRFSALQAVEPFDFALTFEKFPIEASPVASQRFRQFCLKHDLKLEWIPVRIDS